MITLQELCRHLNTLLAIDLFSDVCPNGLQIEGKPTIERIVTAVSCSSEIIGAAIAAEADALVVHHGIFWQGDSPVISGVKKCKIQALLDHGISLLAYHVPLDAHVQVGNNWKAAQEMGWQSLQPFGMFKGSLIGVKGSVPNIPVEELKKHLETYYDHPAHHAPGGKPLIAQIALVSGGAHWSIKEAIAQGIDAFITGSFDEPIWNLAMEEGIHFFALGHAATEKIGPKAIAAYIQDELQIQTTFLDSENPF